MVGSYENMLDRSTPSIAKYSDDIEIYNAYDKNWESAIHLVGTNPRER